MTRMNFISRHAPEPRQLMLAMSAGYELHHVGDVNAFDADEVGDKFTNCDGTAFAVVNAAAALHLATLAWATDVTIAVFENANRAPEGAPSQFAAETLSVWRVPAADFVPPGGPHGVEFLHRFTFPECEDCGKALETVNECRCGLFSNPWNPDKKVILTLCEDCADARDREDEMEYADDCVDPQI